LNSENYPPLEDGVPLNDTRQLAYWLRQKKLPPEQTEYLQELALKIINEFAKQPVKSPAMIREVVAFASIKIQGVYRKLTEQTIRPIRDDVSFDLDLLTGLTEIIQSADRDFLSPDNAEEL